MRNPRSRQKVRFVKIFSLCVSLSFAQFHRETTLRTPRELPDTAETEKVLFVNIRISVGYKIIKNFRVVSNCPAAQLFL